MTVTVARPSAGGTRPPPTSKLGPERCAAVTGVVVEVHSDRHGVVWDRDQLDNGTALLPG